MLVASCLFCVALGSHFEEFVKKQLDSGRFNNVSEVVRAGLRLLEDAERLREIRHQELQAAIQEGSTTKTPDPSKMPPPGVVHGARGTGKWLDPHSISSERKR
jgi:antitoxin ParD1/3/4